MPQQRTTQGRIQEFPTQRQGLDATETFHENDIGLVIGKYIENAVPKDNDTDGYTSPGSVAQDNAGTQRIDEFHTVRDRDERRINTT